MIQKYHTSMYLVYTFRIWFLNSPGLWAFVLFYSFLLCPSLMLPAVLVSLRTVSIFWWTSLNFCLYSATISIRFMLFIGLQILSINLIPKRTSKSASISWIIYSISILWVVSKVDCFLLIVYNLIIYYLLEFIKIRFDLKKLSKGWLLISFLDKHFKAS